MTKISDRTYVKFDTHTVCVKKLNIILICGLLFGLLSCGKERKATDSNQYDDQILEQIYPYIRTVSNGPYINAEVEPGRPNKQGEYSYYFRLIVRKYETWDLLYVERIGIYDEEGIVRKLTKQIFIDLNDVFPETGQGESRYIKSIEWLSDSAINLVINAREYKLNLRDFL